MSTPLETNKSRRVGLVALTVVLTMLVSLITAPSFATEMVTEDSVSVTTDSITSTLDVEFDEPLSRDDADEKMKEYAAEGLITQNSETQKAKGPYSLYCNSPTTVTDFNGKFTAQWKCGGKSVPWGYKLSKTLKSYITSSTVTETGMRSRINNGKLKKASGHTVSKHYQFHGTWYAKKSNIISYYDFFYFNLPKAKGKLTIKGNLKLI